MCLVQGPFDSLDGLVSLVHPLWQKIATQQTTSNGTFLTNAFIGSEKTILGWVGKIIGNHFTGLFKNFNVP